jgi:hypothetical protein
MTVGSYVTPSKADESVRAEIPWLPALARYCESQLSKPAPLLPQPCAEAAAGVRASSVAQSAVVFDSLRRRKTFRIDHSLRSLSMYKTL